MILTLVSGQSVSVTGLRHLRLIIQVGYNEIFLEFDRPYDARRGLETDDRAGLLDVPARRHLEELQPHRSQSQIR